MKTIETRMVPFAAQVRAARRDGSIPMSGHSAVFNQKSLDLGGFIEMIAPGAFAKTLQEADVPLLINHDANLVLARNTSGTLRLREDGVGLYVDADIAPTSYAHDLAILMARGDVSKMSFAFRTVKDDWMWAEDQETPLRIVRELALYDTSIVTYPAYPQTDAALRAQQFDAFMKVLGIDELPEAHRQKFINGVIAREVPQEMRDHLKRVAERLGQIVEDEAPTSHHTGVAIDAAQLAAAAEREARLHDFRLRRHAEFASEHGLLTAVETELRHQKGKHNQKKHNPGGKANDMGTAIDVPRPTAKQLKAGAKMLANFGYDAATIRENLRAFRKNATPAEVAAGKRWYPDAHDLAVALADEYKVDGRTAAAVIAAISPRKLWGNGLSDRNGNQYAARETLKAVANQDNINITVNRELMAKVRGKKGNLYKGPDVPDGVYRATDLDARIFAAADVVGRTLVQNKTKAVRIARGEGDPNVLLGKPSTKIRSFTNNMRDPHNKEGRDDVTVDVHHANAALSFDMNGKGLQDKINAGEITAKDIDSLWTHPGVYEIMRQETIAVSKEFGDDTPADTQAIIWVHELNNPVTTNKQAANGVVEATASATADDDDERMSRLVAHLQRRAAENDSPLPPLPEPFASLSEDEFFEYDTDELDALDDETYAALLAYSEALQTLFTVEVTIPWAPPGEDLTDEDIPERVKKWQKKSGQTGESDEARHLQGKHDQKSHGRKGGAHDEGGDDGGSDDSPGGGGGALTAAKLDALGQTLFDLVHENEGFTYQPVTDDQPKKGFAVALAGNERVVKIDDLTPETLRDYIADRADLYENDPTAHVGGWWNKETDEVFLDVSIVLDDKEAALDLGRKEGQLAIFNLETFETIPTGISREEHDEKNERSRSPKA